MKSILLISRATRKILDLILLSTLGFIIISMVCLVLWQIISRAILSAPSTITEELVRFSLIWLGILGSTYAYGQKQHICITLFVDMIPNNIQKYLNWFIYIVVIIFSIVILLQGGFSIMKVAMMQSSPTLKIPMGYVYLVLPISGFLFLLYTVCDILETNIGE